jgi:hypothetical protein
MREADSQAPIIPMKHLSTRSCKPPLCAVCCLAKASTKGSDTYRTIPNPNKVNALVREDLKPGHRIPLDQYVSSIHGRLTHTFGKEVKKNNLTGGAIFADHTTGHVFMYNQVLARAGNILIGKKKYERLALDSGVSVQTYHADNGFFATKEFKAHCDYKGQELEFSGVGAHHKNGVAERAIKTVSYLARTMLLHMSLHWPEQADLELWPFALEHPVYVWNYLPRTDTHLTHQELYTGSIFLSYDHLDRLHTFGCPVYVLHPRLQDGQKVPKWQTRAPRGQLLGYSTEHLSSIDLILNTNTGNISPQYHVVHNDNFTTVASMDSTKTFDATSWSAILQNGVERYLSDDIDCFGRPLPLLSLHDEWFTDSKKRNDIQRSKRDRSTSQREPIPDVPDLLREPAPHTPTHETARFPRLSQRDLDSNTISGGVYGDSDSAWPRPEPPPATPTRLKFDDEPDPLPRPVPQLPANDGLGRGMRWRKTNSKYDSRDWATYQETIKQKVIGSVLTDCFLQSLDWDKSVQFLKSADFLAFNRANDINRDPEDGSDEWVHPFALAAQENTSSSDTPNWYQAMNGIHSEGYKEAMQIEYETLLSKHAWTEVRHEKWMNVVSICPT